MKIDLKSDRPLDDATAIAETGKTLAQWFALIDAFGGPPKGRRDIGNFLAQTHKLDPWWMSTLNIEYEAARGVLDKDGRPKGYMICATKSIKASPATCYEAFASAAALDRWLGAKHQLQFSEGGALANADGNRAVVKKFTPAKTIRLQWTQPDAAPDTPVEIKFQPAGDKTTVMVSHDRLQTRADADSLRRSWGGALDVLKKVLET